MSGEEHGVILMVKNPPANAGDLKDPGSIPEKGMATHSSILAWRIPWTEVGYSPWGHKESDKTERITLLSCFTMLY